MNERKTEPPQADDLRRQAEERVRQEKAESGAHGSEVDVRALVHELQVSQIELEMQNAELRRAQAAAQELSDKYYDLFDLAPVGYFVLDEWGQIVEVNSAGAALLGQERGALIQKGLEQFIISEDRADFAAFRQQTLQTGRKPVGEFRFLKGEHTVHVQMMGISVAASDGNAKRFRLAVSDISSIRQTEATLRASQEHYRALVEGADIGITQIDLDYNILSANKKQAEIVGRSVIELIGKKCYREYEEREGVCPNCPGAKAIASGAPADMERMGQRKDGSSFAVHVTASPIYDQNGQTTGFIEVVEDITGRKEREKEIASLARFPGENPNPVLRLNSDGVLLYGNRASAPLLAAWGCHEGEPLPSRWRQMAIETLHAKTIQWAECPCGQQVFALTFAPIVDLAYVNIYAQDITKRKRAEEELRKFRTISDKANYGAAMADLDGKFVYVNDTFAQMHGWEAAELLGRHLSVCHNEEQMARLHELYGRLAREGGFSAEEVWHVRRDGSVFPTLMNATAIKDVSGKMQFTSATAVDITERKRAEEALRATNARLEQAVARAEELAVRAEAANNAKSEFLANMSHEIRTPMTAILGFSDLLAMPDLPSSEQREFVEGIQRNGKALLELIGDILDLSTIEADKLRLEKADCPLRQIIDDVMAVVRVQAEQKKQVVKVDYRFPLPETTHTDRTRLRQILTNLLGNAVKFTGEGNIRLTIRYLREADGRGRMQFAVSDTGIGIPADRIDELFQPFTQVDGSASRRYGGTGLGLAISKRLAKALGGDIEVASELGKGSTFTLTIDQGSLADVPMLQAPQAVLAAAAKPLSIAAGPALHGRLLLAEDDPSIQQIICLLLKKMGLEVTVAETGQMACDLAQESKADGRPYDLILMDIQMPNVDGYEATRWLRQHDWQGPIVALTAHTLAGDREKCLAAGCDDYIAKPIILTGLRDVLPLYLSHHRLLENQQDNVVRK
jgi:PAS domain S-box-containing protein